MTLYFNKIISKPLLTNSPLLITWLQTRPITSHGTSLSWWYYLHLLYFQFSLFFRRHLLQPLFFTSASSFITAALCPSCVATVFVQIMHRVWQRQACSCPPQEGICGSGGQAPQDRGEQSASGVIHFIIWESSSDFCWTRGWVGHRSGLDVSEC